MFRPPAPFMPEAFGRSLRHDNLTQKYSVIAAACGSLIMESGGRCGSEVSIMYDKNPKKICDLTANLRERFFYCGNSSRESGMTPACPARLAVVG